MVVNPNGFVQVNDFGNPKVLTGEASEDITSGQIVGVSGATGVVSSGTSSYANNDIKFIVSDDDANAIGMAITTAVSGAPLGVLIDGVVLASCGGTVAAGQVVQTIASSDSVTGLLSGSAAENTFGRAYTAGASGGFAVIHIKA